MAMVLVPPRYRKVSRSVRETQDRAMELVALQEGHGNISRVYQDALDEFLRRTLGRNWEREIEMDQQEVA